MSALIGALRVTLGLDSAAFEKGASAIEKRSKGLERSLTKMGDNMQSVGKKLSLAVTVPLAAFGVSAFKAASDAGELQSAFDVTFGEMSAAMNEWARTTGDAMGRSTQTIQTAANTFGIFFNQAAKTRGEAAELSKTFTVLAQDLGSFFNVSPEVAMEKLRAGLSGESEPLRAFGVFLNENAVAAEAMRMGLAKTSKELTDQDKILARANLILAATKKAQGDVARTSGSTANQVVRAKEAFEELQVTVGNKLLPVITPLIDKLAGLLEAFSRLPDGMQSFIVASGAIAAALGPVLFGIGGLVKSFAPLLAVIGTVAGEGGVLLAAQATFIGLGAAIAPLLPIIAAVAAAGAVIYANWDKIAPVLDEFWQSLQKAVGPDVKAIVADLSAALTELWNGPLGEAVRTAISALGDLLVIQGKVFGPVVVKLIEVLAGTVRNLVSVFADAVHFISALLQGDWRGAMEGAVSIFNRLFGGLPNFIVGVMHDIGGAIREWMIDRLSRTWDQVKDKIDAVKGWFRGLYDAVVGHSYIPDMVEGIAAEMAKLDKAMVEPAKKAAKKTADEFKKLAEEVRPLLDRLFPEAAALRQYRDELTTIDKAVKGKVLTPDQAAEARRRLGREGSDTTTVSQFLAENNHLDSAWLMTSDQIMDQLHKVTGGLVAASDKTKDATVRIAKSFKDMADDTIAALDRMVGAIKGGGFLDILSSVISLGLQLGSIGVFGKKFQTNINGTVPQYAGGTSFHPGGLALVGERGPELVNLPRGSKVHPNGSGMGGDTYVFKGNLLTPEFWAQINAGHVAAADGGGQIGLARVRQANEWALR